jgi:hypothetical protein
MTALMNMCNRNYDVQVKNGRLSKSDLETHTHTHTLSLSLSLARGMT